MHILARAPSPRCAVRPSFPAPDRPATPPVRRARHPGTGRMPVALAPVPSTPLVVIAHDDPGTADSLRHAVETAAGWPVLLADPSPAGLAAALAGGPSVALIGCAALPNLPSDCRTPLVAIGDDDRPPTSGPRSPPAPAASSPGPTAPPTCRASWPGSPRPASPAPGSPAWSSPPAASRAAPAPPPSPSTWPPPGPAGAPPPSC
jgi:hypothetical protein